MATKPALEQKGREIAASIKAIGENTEMTGAQKSEALDKIQPDWEAHLKSVESSERASEMATKMQGSFASAADVKDAKTGSKLDLIRSKSPWIDRGAGMALEMLAEDDAEKYLFKAAGGRQKFDIGFEVGTKDATEANNLMGEYINGASGPTAIGQNPFGSTGNFAAGIMPQWLPGIVENLFYELTIADLISEFNTSAPNISYLTEAGYNPEAKQVAEHGDYPFSSDAVARQYAQVGKVANAMTISDEAIADAPTLWNFVQGRLLEGVQRQEEVQILAGPGMPGVGGLFSTFAPSFTASSSSSLFGATSATGANIAFPPAGTNGAGVVSQTIASLPYGRVVTGGHLVYPVASQFAENLADAFVDIQLQLFKNPNAIVMHPRDWLTLRLGKDGNGQYYNSSFFGGEYGVKNGVVRTIWGVPVITTPLMPQHTVLTGYFDARTIQVARRKGITMQMTNSNGTDFIQGMITARAESRLGLLCYRPSAFQLISLATGA
jgi:HK97 family phage major capsid protein